MGGIARSIERARIETAVAMNTAGGPSVSPAQLSGRGLKPKSRRGAAAGPGYRPLN